jgi:hypothetical protein
MMFRSNSYEFKPLLAIMLMQSWCTQIYTPLFLRSFKPLSAHKIVTCKYALALEARDAVSFHFDGTSIRVMHVVPVGRSVGSKENGRTNLW